MASRHKSACTAGASPPPPPHLRCRIRRGANARFGAITASAATSGAARERMHSRSVAAAATAASGVPQLTATSAAASGAA